MTRARVAAALAAISTVLLLQATVVGPVTYPWPVSLPAVLVAAVAFVDGPSTGMSLGFAAGLIADLGSRHPAGVLALCWLSVGTVCGLAADRRSVRRDAVMAGGVCGVAGAAASLLLALAHGGIGGAVLRSVLTSLVPTLAVDAVLALLVVPIVRLMLASQYLHAAQPSQVQLSVGTRRG